VSASVSSRTRGRTSSVLVRRGPVAARHGHGKGGLKTGRFLTRDGCSSVPHLRGELALPKPPLDHRRRWMPDVRWQPALRYMRSSPVEARVAVFNRASADATSAPLISNHCPASASSAEVTFRSAAHSQKPHSRSPRPKSRYRVSDWLTACGPVWCPVCCPPRRRSRAGGKRKSPVSRALVSGP